MSSPGPPNDSSATVSSHVHSGSAAVLGDEVQCSAAHTSTAFTRPAINALIGKGHEPRRVGRKNDAMIAQKTPSIASSVRTRTRW